MRHGGVSPVWGVRRVQGRLPTVSFTGTNSYFGRRAQGLRQPLEIFADGMSTPGRLRNWLRLDAQM